MPVQEFHAKTLATSETLSRYYMPKAILPADVVRVLNRAKISFVLVGAHAAFGWMHEARATKDVDIVVAAKHHGKAVKLLLEEFPGLKEDDLEVVTRLRDRDTEEVAIDIMKPRDLYRATFKYTHAVQEGKLKYRIPSLEMCLAMKFAPMTSPNRDGAKKLMDAHDFILIVRANPDLDLEKLAHLGDLVYPEGGKEIVELVQRVRAGETLIL